jgi:hypothetical protein
MDVEKLICIHIKLCVHGREEMMETLSGKKYTG